MAADACELLGLRLRHPVRPRHPPKQLGCVLWREAAEVELQRLLQCEVERASRGHQDFDTQPLELVQELFEPLCSTQTSGHDRAPVLHCGTQRTFGVVPALLLHTIITMMHTFHSRTTRAL